MITDNTNVLIAALDKLAKEMPLRSSFPAAWFAPYVPGAPIETKNTAMFLRDKIIEICFSSPNQSTNKFPFVYNAFARYSSAFQLDSNYEKNGNAFRTTGTFLKTIAMLPYIKHLGCDTLYLLPITAIGKYGNKGNMGSPYAIRNHYALDENLSEPLLGLSPEQQFKALVELAHLLGIKVVCEFVFRTASISSEAALAHPDWFYWILEDKAKKFAPPVFEEEVLEIIKEKVEAGDFAELPAPPEEYVAQFTDVPEKVFSENGKIIGITANGARVTIPGAFADWPPDDIQPPWSDVTYLKLFDHEGFNYLAYNTVRMYDDELNTSEFVHAELWDYIDSIIPYYQKEFGIDGVMIDMGHALPGELRKRIIYKAKRNNPNFMIWEENFSLTKTSVKEGYTAALGYMPFDAHTNWKLKQIIRMCADKTTPIPFFATPETHNTKRAADRFANTDFSLLTFAVNVFLPTLLLIHSGFELGETRPVNTGLGFTPEETELFPPEKLPLFSAMEMNWANEKNIVSQIASLAILRNSLVMDKDYKITLEDTQDEIIHFTVSSATKKYIFIGNLSEHEFNYYIEIPDTANILHSHLYSQPDGYIKFQPCGWLIVEEEISANI